MTLPRRTPSLETDQPGSTLAVATGGCVGVDACQATRGNRSLLVC